MIRINVELETILKLEEMGLGPSVLVLRDNISYYELVASIKGVIIIFESAAKIVPKECL